MDASLLLEFVTANPKTSALAQFFEANQVEVCAPQIVILEVLNALRRQVNLKRLSAEKAHLTVQFLQELPINYYSHEELIPRTWQLRGNMNAYDAAYVALAESLDAELWTSDKKFVGTPGLRAQIKLFAPAS